MSDTLKERIEYRVVIEIFENDLADTTESVSPVTVEDVLDDYLSSAGYDASAYAEEM